MQDLYRRETLNSRARNLAVFRPFFSLEAFKGQRGGKGAVDLAPYDLQRLGMVVLDKVILEMGSPAQGATYAQILDATKPMLLAANSACTDHDADIVTTLVVEHLCNEQQRTVFVITYQFEKEDGAIEWRENRFKIAEIQFDGLNEGFCVEALDTGDDFRGHAGADRKSKLIAVNDSKNGLLI
jgi:hypothetical protein